MKKVTKDSINFDFKVTETSLNFKKEMQTQRVSRLAQ